MNKKMVIVPRRNTRKALVWFAAGCAAFQMHSALAFHPCVALAPSAATRVKLPSAHATAQPACAAAARAERRPRSATGARSLAMQDPNVVFDFVAGGLAGTLASVATQPFYVAKTKMQQHSMGGEAGEEEVGGGGVVKTLVEIVQRDGVGGLFVGALPVLIFAFPESALQLSSHDWFVAALGDNSAEERLPLLLQVLAAGLAGIPSVLATNPMDMLAIRAASDEKHSSSNMRSNIEALGTQTLFCGFTTTWLRDVPFLGIFFPLFVYLSTLISDALASTCPSWEFLDASSVLAAGIVAGMFASAITTPADVINVAVKTRLLRDHDAKEAATKLFRVTTTSSSESPALALLSSFSSAPSTLRRPTLTAAFSKTRTQQSQGTVAAGMSPALQVSLVLQVVAQLYAEKGLGAFFSGVSARVSQIMPAQALTIVVYAFLHWLHSLAQ
jgi:hypothetical protein